MRLNPLDPIFFGLQTGTAVAHFLAGRYNEASSWAEKAVVECMTFLPALRITAASHALAGRLEQAQKATACARELDPAFRTSDIKDVAPFRQPEDVARYTDGLRKFGLPE
jgi:hypothetical protein